MLINGLFFAFIQKIHSIDIIFLLFKLLSLKRTIQRNFAKPGELRPTGLQCGAQPSIPSINGLD